MKRNTLLVIGLASLVLLAGCGGGPDSSGDDLADDTGTELSGTELGESYKYEIKLTEKNQQNLVRQQPPFEMESSLERKNLIDRYQYLNDQNNVHHIYLLGNDGAVVSYYVAQGKVSSVNSKLTNDEQIVARQDCLRTTNNGGEGACFKTVESPQMDGSYGTNGDGIFFFTTQGIYVETNLKYVVAEEPRQIQTQPVLVQQVGDGQQNSTSISSAGVTASS
jgi:hypothetical protein